MTPLFWVHGDASEVPVVNYLGADQSVFALRHQCRDGRPALHTRVETIAAHYLAQMRTVQANGPYFLGGYSFGGTVAFEIARQLQAEGQQVSLLVMIDSLSPGTDVQQTPLESSLTVETAPSLPRIRRHLQALWQLEHRAKFDYVSIRTRASLKGRLRVFNGTAITACLTFGRPLPVSLRSPYLLDIYYKAIRNYAPPSFRGDVIYVKSEARSSLHASQWRRLVDHLDIHEIPGSNHQTIIEGPHVAIWAEHLRVGLLRAQSQGGVLPVGV